MSEQKFSVGDRVVVSNHIYSSFDKECGTVIGRSRGRGHWSIRLDSGQSFNFEANEMSHVGSKTSRKSPKQRVYHSEEAKQEALAYWRAHSSRPKAAIARKFGINPGTFNMWTRELEPVVIGDRVKVVDFSQEPAVATLLEQILFETKGVREELKKINGRYK